MSNEITPEVGQVWQKSNYHHGMFYYRIIKMTDKMIFFRQCSQQGEVFKQSYIKTFRCKIENVSLNLGVLTNI